MKVLSDTRVYPSLQIQVYHTPRLVSQNTFRYSRTGLDMELQSPDGRQSTIMHGLLQMYEWAGSVRFNLLTGRIQSFAKAGFGYSWYRVQGVTVGGEPPPSPTSPFLHTPSLQSLSQILPNTLHYGAGIEASPDRAQGAAHRHRAGSQVRRQRVCPLPGTRIAGRQPAGPLDRRSHLAPESRPCAAGQLLSLRAPELGC